MAIGTLTRKVRSGEATPHAWTSSSRRLPALGAAAFVIAMTLLPTGLLPAARGSPSLPHPATGPTPRLVLSGADIDGDPLPLPVSEIARFDIVLLHLYEVNPDSRGQPDLVQQIKRVNPNSKVLLYGTFSNNHTWQENWGTLNAHESWFMHNPGGRRTQNGGDSYFMDIRNAEYRNYAIQHTLDFLNTYGFDGVFWDVAGGSLSLFDLNPGPDPAAARTWHQDMLTFLREFKTALRSKWLITNSTQTYDTGAAGDDADYLPIVDGTMMEGYGHAWWNGPNDPPADWGYQQRMAQRNVAAGKTLHVQGGAGEGSHDQKRRWQLFSYGSSLLWADGAHIYNWWMQPLLPEMTVPLGSPLGAPYASGGVTQRDFTGGKVLVNPSGQARRANLPSPLRSPAGARVTTVDLPPWSAVLLVK